MRSLKIKLAVLAAALLPLFVGQAQAQTIPGVTDDAIRAFYATNPTNDKIESMARELGLNTDQIMHATEIGSIVRTGNDYKTAPSWQVMGAYGEANHMTGNKYAPGASFYAPNLGREVTPTEIAAFYVTNPTASQVLAKASELGISAAAIPNASAFGGSYQGSDAKDVQFLNMGNSLNSGANGYGTNSAGQIVSKSDPGAMYSSDPLHQGLDRRFDGQPVGPAPGLVNNPAIPFKKWTDVQAR